MSSNDSEEDLKMLKSLSASADVYIASMVHCNTDRTTRIMKALHF
jgi:hypothetical protein